MDLTKKVSAEEVFVQVSDLVSGEKLTPNAAMSLVAEALCLMAVVWRPPQAGRLETQQFVHGLVEAWLHRLEQHPFAAGRPSH